ncbi:MAG: sulfatase [Bryobacteraceae bacterium]|nr:sulfatase [Bryobacteraceae bacterium]
MTSRRSFLGGGAATLAAPLVRAQQKRPNILFVIADDWGRGHAGAYGCEWVRTPSFDRVAREGVLFTNCFTSNPKCSPSRASILTGRNAWQVKEAMVHYSILPRDYAAFPALLEAAGYATGHTGKGWGPGDFTTTGWPHNPAGRPFQERRTAAPHSGINTCDYASNFEDFLNARPAGRPFCFWMGGYEPHRVYEAGAGIRAKRDPRAVRVPAYYPDQPLIRSDLLDYAMELEHFDSHLGRALTALEQRGELENTLVAVTSDNGMPFPRAKAHIYEDGFHLPLAVRFGGQAAGGRTVTDFIQMRDFAPTFLEAAGVDRPASMTGRSFLDVLRASRSGTVDATRNVALAGKERHDLGRPGDAGYPVRAIRTPDWLYVRNYEPDRWPSGNPETGYRECDDSPTKEYLLARFDEYYRLSFGKRPAEELYDVRTDPECVRNVAGASVHGSLMAGLRARMEGMLREEGDPRFNGNAAFYDNIRYTGSRSHAWDTWERFRGAEGKR